MIFSFFFFNILGPLLFESGLIGEQLSYSEDEKCLLYGIGLTNMVARTTRSAAELSRYILFEWHWFGVLLTSLKGRTLNVCCQAPFKGVAHSAISPRWRVKVLSNYFTLHRSDLAARTAPLAEKYCPIKVFESHKSYTP